MTSRALGVGNGRVFRRSPSQQEVRFIAPVPRELARDFFGKAAESLAQRAITQSNMAIQDSLSTSLAPN
jgi:hypothetical protein